MRWLTDHIGHSLDVERELYLIKDSIIELAKVSCVLLALDEGNDRNISGSKLSEIQIEDNTIVFNLFELQSP